MYYGFFTIDKKLLNAVNTNVHKLHILIILRNLKIGTNIGYTFINLGISIDNISNDKVKKLCFLVDLMILKAFLIILINFIFIFYKL